MATPANLCADPTTDKPPRRKRWIPLSLRLFVATIRTVPEIRVRNSGYHKEGPVPMRCRDWLPLSVCLITAACLWSTQSRADEAAAVELIRQRGGSVEYEGKDAERAVVSVSLPGGKISDDDLKVLKELPKLRGLSVSGQTGKSPPRGNGRITDAGLRDIAALTSLESLDLRANRITDEGLKELRTLTKLRTLDLSMTAITDDGLRELQALKHLESLRIWDVGLTDAALSHLRPIKSLKRLALAHAKVTETGLSSLREALPDIKAENKIYGR
jgi:hypothetical protein